jgi:hypothetical protein
MPKAWGRVARVEMDVRPGGIFSIDIAGADARSFPTWAASWTSFRWSGWSGPPCCSPATVRRSSTTFRSPPS